MIAATNVAIYVLMVRIGPDPGDWHLSPTALLFLLVSVIALVAISPQCTSRRCCAVLLCKLNRGSMFLFVPFASCAA
jgi:hypothetical protein